MKLKPSNERVLNRDCAPIIEMIEAFALQNQKTLESEYFNMPDESYWSILKGRELELFAPLLVTARFAGKPIENKLIDVVTKSSFRKKAIAVEESPDLTACSEMYQCLGNLPEDQERIQTAKLIEPLRNLEGYWAKKLKGSEENIQSDASTIGNWLKRYRSLKKKREPHTTYDINQLCEELALSLNLDVNPTSPPKLQEVQDSPEVID